MIDDATLSFEHRGDIIVATVKLAELTSTATDMVLLRLRQSLEAGQSPRMVLDLSGVKFVDSVALGTLVVLLRRVKQADGRLALVGLGGHVLKVMQVTGLQKVFEMYADLPAALAALQRA